MLWSPAAPVISAVDDSWAPICWGVKFADEVPDVLTNFRPSMLVSVAEPKLTLVPLVVDPTWIVSLPEPPLNESPAFAVPASNTNVSSWLVPTYVSTPDVAKMLIVSVPLVQLANCRPDRLSEPPADWENCRVSAWPLPVTVAVDDTRLDPSWVRPLKVWVGGPRPAERRRRDIVQAVRGVLGDGREVDRAARDLQCVGAAAAVVEVAALRGAGRD